MEVDRTHYQKARKQHCQEKTRLEPQRKTPLRKAQRDLEKNLRQGRQKEWESMEGGPDTCKGMCWWPTPWGRVRKAMMMMILLFLILFLKIPSFLLFIHYSPLIPYEALMAPLRGLNPYCKSNPPPSPYPFLATLHSSTARTFLIPLFHEMYNISSWFHRFRQKNNKYVKSQIRKSQVFGDRNKLDLHET